MSVGFICGYWDLVQGRTIRLVGFDGNKYDSMQVALPPRKR
jgi:hypothetical protein